MKEKLEKVFELLGVKPNEKFTVMTKAKKKQTYLINPNLEVVWVRSDGSEFRSKHLSIKDFLTDKAEILKMSTTLTSLEEKLIETIRKKGYNYIAVDKDGEAYAYVEKPHKHGEEWYNDGDCKEIIMEVSFASWQDDEPYEI